MEKKKNGEGGKYLEEINLLLSIFWGKYCYSLSLCKLSFNIIYFSFIIIFSISRKFHAGCGTMWRKTLISCRSTSSSSQRRGLWRGCKYLNVDDQVFLVILRCSPHLDICSEMFSRCYQAVFRMFTQDIFKILKDIVYISGVENKLRKHPPPYVNHFDIPPENEFLTNFTCKIENPKPSLNVHIKCTT